MNQTAQNRANLNRVLRNQPRPAPQLSAEGLRRMAFAKNFAKRDLMEASAQYGARHVSNFLNTQSILSIAAQKFNAMKGQK